MVRNPFVFLLDEPLSNLDTKLRNQMRTEIVQLHQRLGKTFVYVTHDQIEAMTMGDRIVVMKDGFIKQVDKPQNVYDKPYNLFVAGFIGAPQMNFIDVLVSEKNGDYCVGFHSYLFKLPRGKVDAQSFQEYVGKIVVMGIRPENLNLADTFASDNIFEAKVVIAEMLGQEIQLLLDCGDVKFKTKVPPDKNAPPKKGIALFFSILFREYKNLIVVNLIFILFSLPVITIGPAFAGMIHVIFKIIRDRPVFPFSDFIDGFKKNFRQSFVYTMLFTTTLGLAIIFMVLSELNQPAPFSLYSDGFVRRFADDACDSKLLLYDHDCYNQASTYQDNKKFIFVISRLFPQEYVNVCNNVINATVNSAIFPGIAIIAISRLFLNCKFHHLLQRS